MQHNTFAVRYPEEYIYTSVVQTLCYLIVGSRPIGNSEPEANNNLQ